MYILQSMACQSLNKVTFTRYSDFSPPFEPSDFKNSFENGIIFFKDNILYCRYNARGSTVSQLVLPEIYRGVVLTGLHDDAGHQGRDRTTSLVDLGFTGQEWMEI